MLEVVMGFLLAYIWFHCICVRNYYRDKSMRITFACVKIVMNEILAKA